MYWATQISFTRPLRYFIKLLQTITIVNKNNNSDRALKIFTGGYRSLSFPKIASGYLLNSLTCRPVLSGFSSPVLLLPSPCCFSQSHSFQPGQPSKHPWRSQGQEGGCSQQPLVFSSMIHMSDTELCTGCMSKEPPNYFAFSLGRNRILPLLLGSPPSL